MNLNVDGMLNASPLSHIHVHLYFLYTSSEGSGESTHVHKLARNFVGRRCDTCKYKSHTLTPLLFANKHRLQGWATGMAGPAFPDLSQIVNVDLAAASWLFSVGCAG